MLASKTKVNKHNKTAYSARTPQGCSVKKEKEIDILSKLFVFVTLLRISVLVLQFLSVALAQI